MALEADADVAVWRRGFLELVRDAGARRSASRPRVHVKHDSGHGPARASATRGDVARAGRGRRRGPPSSSWPGSGPTSRPPTSPTRRSSTSSSSAFDELARAAARASFGGLLAARRQQRRHPARARVPLRHGPLRDRDLRARPLRRATRAERGLEPALELRSYVADVKRFEPATAPATGGPGGAGGRHLGRRAADRLRRRRPPRRSPTTPRCWSAGGATRSSGTVSMDNVTIDLGAGDRRRARRRGGADRRPGRRADPRRGAGPAAGDDQLRDHLRDLGRGCRGSSPGRDERAGSPSGCSRVAAPSRPPRAALGPRRRAGSSAARSATRRSARAVVDLDLAVAGDPREAARGDRARGAAGHAFELSAEFGTWRALAAGTATGTST